MPCRRRVRVRALFAVARLPQVIGAGRAAGVLDGDVISQFELACGATFTADNRIVRKLLSSGVSDQHFLGIPSAELRVLERTSARSTKEDSRFSCAHWTDLPAWSRRLRRTEM